MGKPCYCLLLLWPTWMFVGILNFLLGTFQPNRIATLLFRSSLLHIFLALQELHMDCWVVVRQWKPGAIALIGSILL